MRQLDPMRGGAIWCEQHQRWECSKRTKTAPVCHGIAIAGIDRCRMHAGENVDLAKAKGEAMTAWAAWTGEQLVSSTDAVLGMLQLSWLRAELLGQLLRQQFTQAQAAADEDGGGPGGEHPELGPGRGLVGHTRAAAKDIGIFVSGEAPRALTVLEGLERDRVVKYAKVAHDMGIAEQQVRIAEQYGQMLADVIRGSLDAHLDRVLGVLGDDPRAHAIQQAWPEWMNTIVPAQIAAIAPGGVA
ncbi:hypothetical protein [Nonomuraea sp. NPDC049646]|uniref:hypothetical protein n=1 Tax=unclassified Nonomuraea TaxID=2593643 RepID=UPI003793C5D1